MKATSTLLRKLTDAPLGVQLTLRAKWLDLHFDLSAPMFKFGILQFQGNWTPRESSYFPVGEDSPYQENLSSQPYVQESALSRVLESSGGATYAALQSWRSQPPSSTSGGTVEAVMRQIAANDEYDPNVRKASISSAVSANIAAQSKF